MWNNPNKYIKKIQYCGQDNNEESFRHIIIVLVYTGRMTPYPRNPALAYLSIRTKICNSVLHDHSGCRGKQTNVHGGIQFLTLHIIVGRAIRLDHRDTAVIVPHNAADEGRLDEVTTDIMLYFSALYILGLRREKFVILNAAHRRRSNVSLFVQTIQL